MSDQKPTYRPYADLKVKIREYKSEGKMKGVWFHVGTIFATPHLSSQFMTIEGLPINCLDKDGNTVPFNGKVTIFKRDDFASQEEVTSADYLVSDGKTKDVVLDDIDDKPIDLSEIPF